MARSFVLLGLNGTPVEDHSVDADLRLIAAQTGSLQARVDALCGVYPECLVRSYQRFGFPCRQLDAPVAQSGQRSSRVAQESNAIPLVGHQPSDDQLNRFQRHGCSGFPIAVVLSKAGAVLV